MARTYAYCFASGLIDFGPHVPDGALQIARGRGDVLRNFITGVARHGYKTRKVRGRPTKIPGSDHLLVPGVPEAPDENAAYVALRRFALWIGEKPPGGVAVMIGGA